jgi:reactive intermediate/imine deaminase
VYKYGQIESLKRGKKMKKLLVLLILIVSPAQTFAETNTDKSAILTENAPAPIGIYSQAIKVDNTIYISGQIPLDPKTGNLIAGDFNKQAKQVLNNLSAITKAAGANLDNIVKLTVYMTDLANFAILNKTMSEYFHQPYPARVVIEVKGLPKQAPIEIEAIMKTK